MDFHLENSENMVHALIEAKEYAESIIETVREPLVVLDSSIRVIYANYSFYDTFRVSRRETIGLLFYDLGKRQWDLPKLRMLLEEILKEDTVFNDYKVEHNFEHIGKRIMYLNARRIYRKSIKAEIILLAIEDVTKRITIENELKQKNNELQKALSEIKFFHGIIPICSFCKKIRNDKGYWEQVEVYIKRHSEVDFSHSICPKCVKEHYSDL
jgi:PAS domain S-box-containing protein